MYNPEITNLINENFELGFKAAALLTEINKTWNFDLVPDFEAIHETINENRKKIKILRGEING